MIFIDQNRLNRRSEIWLPITCLFVHLVSYFFLIFLFNTHSDFIYLFFHKMIVWIISSMLSILKFDLCTGNFVKYQKPNLILRAANTHVYDIVALTLPRGKKTVSWRAWRFLRRGPRVKAWRRSTPCGITTSSRRLCTSRGRGVCSSGLTPGAPPSTTMTRYGRQS